MSRIQYVLQGMTLKGVETCHIFDFARGLAIDDATVVSEVGILVKKGVALWDEDQRTFKLAPLAKEAEVRKENMTG